MNSPNQNTAPVAVFYARKIFGSYFYYFGVLTAVVLLILLLNKNFGTVAKYSFVALLAIWNGKANMKPRITLTKTAVIANPNSMTEHISIPLTNISNVETKKFRIILKTGKPVNFAGWEFSKKTREQTASAINMAVSNLK